MSSGRTRAIVVWLWTLVVAATLVGAQARSARLLVLLRNASELAIVDPRSGKMLGRISTVNDPHEVTASPDGKLAFVASPSEGIAVIDLTTLKELRRIDTGRGSAPHDVRFAEGKLYFTAEGYKVIGRYDPATNTLDWLLGIGQESTHMLVLSKDVDTIFTANRRSNSVTMVSGVSAGPPKWQIAAIAVGGQLPEGIDLSPDGREVWTATRGDGGVSIIDVRAKTLVRRLDLKLKEPNRLKFTPDGRRVLISDGAGANLVVVDVVSRREVTRLGLAPNAVLVEPDGSHAYAALMEDDQVAVVDLQTFEIAARIPTGSGSGPGCMVWIAEMK